MLTKQAMVPPLNACHNYALAVEW